MRRNELMLLEFPIFLGKFLIVVGIENKAREFGILLKNINQIN